MQTGERSDKCDRGGNIPVFLQENILIFCLFSSDIIGSPVSQSDSDISFIIISQEGSSTSTLHLIRKEGLVEKYKYHQTPDCIDIVLT